MESDQERAEKLKAAKEKLKKFQLMKASNSSGPTSPLQTVLDRQQREQLQRNVNYAEDANIVPAVLKFQESAAERSEELLDYFQTTQQLQHQQTMREKKAKEDKAEAKAIAQQEAVDKAIAQQEAVSTMDPFGAGVNSAFQKVEVQATEPSQVVPTVGQYFQHPEEEEAPPQQGAETWGQVQENQARDQRYQQHHQQQVKQSVGQMQYQQQQEQLQQDQQQQREYYDQFQEQQQQQEDVDTAVADTFVPYPECPSQGQTVHALQAEKQQLEEDLEQHKTALQQYETYCQNLTGQLSTLQQSQAVAQAEGDGQLQEEVSCLRTQLQSHKESLDIMVADKTELQTSVGRLEQTLGAKDDQIVNLSSKLDDVSLLNSSQNNTSSSATISPEEAEALRTDISRLQKELKERGFTVEEKNDELSELQSRLERKQGEHEALTRGLKEQSTKLELAELHLSQLRAVQESGGAKQDDGEAKARFEQDLREREDRIAVLEREAQEQKAREAELTAYIQQASHDREQIIQQYTTYSKQLAEQIEGLTAQYNEKATENAQLLERESGLRSHVEQLESQLQTLIQSNSNSKQSEQVQFSQVDANQTEVMRKQLSELDKKMSTTLTERDGLQERMNEKDYEIQSLTMALSGKDAQISELETRTEMLSAESSNAAMNEDLVAACESDKVAAARAMKQNQEMKEQMFYLENAVIKLTNSKVDLTAELDSIKRKLYTFEDTLQDLEQAKDDLAENEKTIGQLREQMKYYVAFAENSISTGGGSSHPDEMICVKEREKVKEEALEKVQDELNQAKEQICNLNSHNLELRGQLEVLASQTREPTRSPSSSSSSSIDTPTNLSVLVPPPQANGGSASSSVSTSSIGSSIEMMGDEMVTQAAAPLVVNKVNSVPTISHDVAFLKLEQKFNSAMGRIAELSSQKEELEHVNVQLQEETETVGEYITIYQYQRQQIKKRMDEKESQLQMVSREREELKTKLQKLQKLVTNFMGTKQQQQQSGGGSQALAALQTNGQEVIEEAVEASSALMSTSAPPPSSSSPSPNPGTTEQNAEEILALFSEIGENQVLHQEFQPWFFFWDNTNGKPKMMEV